MFFYALECRQVNAGLQVLVGQTVLAHKTGGPLGLTRGSAQRPQGRGSLGLGHRETRREVAAAVQLGGYNLVKYGK